MGSRLRAFITDPPEKERLPAERLANLSLLSGRHPRLPRHTKPSGLPLVRVAAPRLRASASGFTPRPPLPPAPSVLPLLRVAAPRLRASASGFTPRPPLPPAPSVLLLLRVAA